MSVCNFNIFNSGNMSANFCLPIYGVSHYMLALSLRPFNAMKLKWCGWKCQ